MEELRAQDVPSLDQLLSRLVSPRRAERLRSFLLCTGIAAAGVLLGLTIGPGGAPGAMAGGGGCAIAFEQGR